MKPIQIIAQDLFDKVRSRFTNLEMGDENGSVTIDPIEARFFDFDFVHEGTNFGRVSISINDLGRLKVYFNKAITEDTDDSGRQIWYKFLKEMRQFAMRRLLTFDTRDISKANLDKNDFKYLATTQPPKEEENMQMNESMFNGRNTRKTSRAVKGMTEVIVRHNAPVDDMVLGSRARKKNIRAIFIQNKDGERFKYPFIHIAGALAMARHVDEGGVPHDNLGKKIIEMSQNIAQLQEFHRHVNHASLHDDAMGITEKTLTKLQELKTCVEALSGRKYYKQWAENMHEKEVLGDDLYELDDVAMEDYKSKFTEKTFKEDLLKYFPLIHKIMQEHNNVDIEQYVNTAQAIDEEIKEEDVPVSEFDSFESWADSTEQGELNRQQLDTLKYEIEKQNAEGPLDLGQDGTPAIDFFAKAGINRENLPTSMIDDLEGKMEVTAKEFPETNPMEVFYTWAKQNYPSLLAQLGLETQQPQTEDAPIATVHGMMPAVENEEMGGFPNTTMSKESDDHKKMTGQKPSLHEIADIVKQYYNAATPDAAPFRSPTAVCQEVEQKCTEKYGEECRNYSRTVAEKIIESLTRKWEERHGISVEAFKPDEPDAEPQDYTIPAVVRRKKGTPPLTMPGVLAHDERHKREFEKRKAQVASGNLGETEFIRLKKLAGLKK